MKTKDKLYNRFLKTCDKEVFIEFRRYCNKLTKELRTANEDYFCNLFTPPGRRDVTWKRLNALLNRSTLKNPIKIIRNSEELKGSLLANQFNDYFVDLARSKLDERILGYIKHTNDKSCFLNPVK